MKFEENELVYGGKLTELFYGKQGVLNDYAVIDARVFSAIRPQ